MTCFGNISSNLAHTFSCISAVLPTQRPDEYPKCLPGIIISHPLINPVFSSEQVSSIHVSTPDRHDGHDDKCTCKYYVCKCTCKTCKTCSEHIAKIHQLAAPITPNLSPDEPPSTPDLSNEEPNQPSMKKLSPDKPKPLSRSRSCPHEEEPPAKRKRKLLPLVHEGPYCAVVNTP